MDWARVRTLAKGDRECQHYFCESPLQVPETSSALIRTYASARLSRDPTHRELVYRPFQFQKCGQLFIGTHNETLSVAMSVRDPDGSPFHVDETQP
jgi:hypothetical protein